MINDQLDEYLCKANALMQIALHDSFLDFPEKIIHDYLWALSEMLEKIHACLSPPMTTRP